MNTSRIHRLLSLIAFAAALAPAGLVAQQQDGSNQPAATPTDQPIVIQHMRAPDRRGINVFEPPKDDGVPFTGFRLDWGGAFTQQYQAIDHENTAAPKMSGTVNQNQLMDIGGGFNNATANLDLNVQIAPGMRVALTTYLSSRHHQETWVKDGYLLIDESPLNVGVLNDIMKVVTLKAGHFEVDYGDAHYRRTDNGRAIYNPFVGNLILDAFTTQIGAHVYARKYGLIAMGGVTGGEIKGEIRFPEQRGLAYLGKLGFDRDFGPARVRLTGSVYHQGKGLSNTVFGGDRAGSRYYYVMENTTATTNTQAWSGHINPGFGSELTSYMVNPFVDLGPVEFFGTYERAEGRAASEAESRVWSQYAGDAIYRFAGEDLFLAARYNRANGELSGMTTEPTVERWQLAGGWYITNNLMLKGEWVRQAYEDFPISDIRNGGLFDGFVLEGVVAF
jgi:hypothetical protein